jgi:hypothetical protein
MGAGFQEGLSLTVHDEISRYCKYAFGCSEMIFNPLRQWSCKGPISSLFRTYVGLRCIPWYTKVLRAAHAARAVRDLPRLFAQGCAGTFLHPKQEAVQLHAGSLPGYMKASLRQDKMLQSELYFM